MKEIVTMCFCCDRVRDDLVGNHQAEERWQEFSMYLRTYGLSLEDVQLSHTYCPPCLKAYRQLWMSPVKVATASEEEDPSQLRHSLWKNSAGA